MSNLLNISEFCKNLKEIKSSKIVNNKGRFTNDGLFSEQIFGPVQNYTCQCGTFYGQSRTGEICKECGVEIMDSGERRKRFAKIKLPISIVNPVFYDLITNIGGPKKELDELMSNEKSILYKKDNNKYCIVYDKKDVPDGIESFEYDSAIFELIDGTSKQNKDNEKWKYVQENIDKLLTNEIIVLPADLRPASKAIDRKSDHSHIVDKINRYYRKLLIKKEKMLDTYIEIKSSKKIYYDYYKQIQRVVNELYDYILNSLSKKDGLIRGNILGKRIDFSGRAVIVPDPTLNLDECKLPYFMFLELFKIRISKALINDGYFKFLNSSIQFVDDCILKKSYNLFNFCLKMLNKNPQVCILNRQPSLHKLGMLGFKVKIEESSVHYIRDKNGQLIPTGDPKKPYKIGYIHSNVIKIHPLVCPCFNADFDGDQMAVYVPISKKAHNEILNKFLVTKNLTNPSNGELTTVPSQDIILGIYALTSNKFPKLQKEIQYKNKIISKGRLIFNNCLPDNYPVIDMVITKKELLKILNDIKDNYNEQITANVLDKIKKIGFEFASLFGPTMSLDQFQLKDGLFKEKIYEGEIIDQLNKISSKETEEYLRQNFSYAYMIDSGSRGSWDQARQIVLSRGFISNFRGEIVPTPVKSSLIEGLNPREFFISTWGCRKGLLDVAINTGDSGYLSRKMIFTCANLQKDLEVDDCGTTDFLSINVDSIKKAEMLMFRYYLNNRNNLIEITKENYTKLIGKTIRLRSPIFCKNYNICHKCYGNLWKFLNTKFVGIISAQSLGERSTQLILRTFHTSGVANIKEEKNDMKQDDIIADLSIASKIFHHFENNKDYNQIIDELFKIYNSNGKIHHIHIESIVAQLMWSESTKWRLLKNRDQVKPEYYSIQKVPSYESWVLGLGFSDPKRHIIKGLMNKGNYYGIMDKILLGKKL
jgi:DNA-directed RNA polymerase subunit beta'